MFTNGNNLGDNISKSGCTISLSINAQSYKCLTILSICSWIKVAICFWFKELPSLISELNTSVATPIPSWNLHNNAHFERAVIRIIPCYNLNVWILKKTMNFPFGPQQNHHMNRIILVWEEKLLIVNDINDGIISSFIIVTPNVKTWMSNDMFKMFADKIAINHMIFSEKDSIFCCATSYNHYPIWKMYPMFIYLHRCLRYWNIHILKWIPDYVSQNKWKSQQMVGLKFSFVISISI